MKRILRYLKPFKKQINLGLFLIFVSSLFNVFLFYFEGRFITDKMQNYYKDKNSFSVPFFGNDIMFYIIFILCINLFLYFVVVMCRVFFNKMLISSIHQGMRDLRQDVQKKIHRLPIKYFDSNTLGNIMSRMTNDIEVISNALQQSFSIMLAAFLMIVMIVCFMFVLHLFLGIIVFMMIPFSFYAIYKVFTKSQKIFIQRFDASGNHHGFLQEKYTGYKEIILYNQQNTVIEEFSYQSKYLEKLVFKSNFLSGLTSPIVCLFTHFTLIAVSMMGFFLIEGHNISLFLTKLGVGVIGIGLFRCFLQFVWRLGNPIIEIGHMSVLLQSANAASRRVFAFLNEIEEAPEVLKPQVIANPQGEVVFENVSFGYNKRDMLLRNINFVAKPGQTIAIVGPTGSGKSTLINLLMRFYDINAGSIKVDGVDIRELKKDNLRTIFGMVLQDTWFFKDTIWQNIKYGKQDATDEEVIQAAKQAQVNYFINTKPNGYQMQINEEADNLSQGEKQLITIARTILSNPKILILDEATSNVDTRIEILLQQAIQKLIQNKTAFVIAHRLSTIVNADKILVLHRGAIIEQGTHQELLNYKGFYYKLYQSQFQK
ncbi:ABC transporter ATP-binding protein [Candidatus Phytoplasma asteris]|uniref:ABC-type multidrug/protein/lipid transport system ATP-binding and permease protein n=2 Tax=16SrI (Aster yellows group) TaxID=3042590 RepID=A0A859I903_9MOLU|nr:MAG: ABC-type multidrug/protein/lipid transport system ATP-binding and permease protein [Rapeseed phyllody phytoplasma]